MLLPSMLPLDVVMVHHHHIKREHWCPLHKAPLLPLSHHYTLDVVVGVAVVVLALVSPCCKPLGSKNPTHGAFYRSIGSCTNTWIYETYCLKDQYNLQGYSHQCVQMAPAAASRGTATNAYKWPLQQPGGIASFTNGYRRRIINNHPSTITLLQLQRHNKPSQPERTDLRSRYTKPLEHNKFGTTNPRSLKERTCGRGTISPCSNPPTTNSSGTTNPRSLKERTCGRGTISPWSTTSSAQQTLAA
jgi:hypothetical protein